METELERNKRLCDRYPFLIPRNAFTDQIPEDFDYSYTELDCMPQGWRIAFGEQMCEEIREALIEENFLNEYRVVQIKEKYGGLRWYSGPASEKVHDIVSKYEVLSEKTCIVCGKPATKISMGWISPFCNCVDNDENFRCKCVPIEKFYK